MNKKTEIKKIELKIKVTIIFAGIFTILALIIICFLGINKISFGQILDPIIYISLFIPSMVCIALPFIIVKCNEKVINETKRWEIKEFEIQKNLDLLSIVSPEFEHTIIDETCSINFKKNKKIFSYIVCIKDKSNQFKEEELYDKLSDSILINTSVGYRRVIYILQDMNLNIVDALLKRNICPDMNSDFITFAHYESSSGILKINFTKLEGIKSEKIVKDILFEFFMKENVKSTMN